MSGKVGSITTSIIVDGLVLNMDAANRASYPKTGTTWVDTINGNNGTLINGPTFDSADGGSIDFDGTDQLINIGNIPALTFDRFDPVSSFAFCYPKDTGANGIMGKRQQGGAFRGLEFRFYLGKLEVEMFNTIGGNKIYISSTNTYPINNWYNVGFTYDGSSNANGFTLYINGVSIPFTTVFNSLTSTIVTTNPFQIGTGRNNTNYFNGNIANAQVYNKELSSTEVLQNYNALKDRFI